MVFEPPTMFSFMMSCAGDVVDRKALSIIETRYANHGLRRPHCLSRVAVLSGMCVTGAQKHSGDFKISNHHCFQKPDGYK